MYILIGILLIVLAVVIMIIHSRRVKSKLNFLVIPFMAAGIIGLILGSSTKEGFIYWLNSSWVITTIVAVLFATGIYLLLKKITATFRKEKPTPKDREPAF
jgi:uncharacterized membrane protein YfcA